MELTEIIRRGIVTEKTVGMQNSPKAQQRAQARREEMRKKNPDQDIPDVVFTHRYVFEVALHANKIQIRQAVEALYDVNVVSVNTMRMPGKSRTIRTRKGWRRSAAHPWKKAIVTVRENQTIPDLHP